MNMKKKLAILLIVSLAFGFNFVMAEVDQQTVNYLSNAQQNAWVTQALKAVGQENLNISYLNDYEGDNATDYAKAVLAVVAAGENPYDYQNQNFVSGLRSYYESQQIGSVNLLNDDFWGIIALRSADELVDSQIIRDSRDFILEAQNQDGGWSYAPNAESDSNDTAAAIMALLEAGQQADSQEIQNALEYLQSVQNEDGGFAFTEGQSDSGSDAWVITALNKLNIDANSWTQEDNTPVSHLQSLMLDDGSFKWLESDEQGSLLMTAFAAVALSGSSYPIAYYQPPEDEGVYHLRIEGSSKTICNAQVEGATALEVLENGAEICDYTYNIQDTDWGPYLNQINNEQAEGNLGWLYWVNWLSPMVGAGDYELEEGDEVLFAFGSWGIQPLRISLSTFEAELNQEVTAQVEYFNGESWQASAEAIVNVGNSNYQTNQNGQVTFSVGEDATFRVYAEKEGFIRSERAVVVVGFGSQETINLSVNIQDEQAGADEEEQAQDEVISFSVNTNNLSFGDLRPGGQSVRSITVTNNSEASMYLESEVLGDPLFEDNIYLAGELWENFNTVIENEGSTDVSVSLQVPQNYQSGVYEGSLVLWASSN